MIDWNPNLNRLREIDGELRFVISAFIKLSALKQLDSKLNLREGLNVIVRWLPEDIEAGF